MEFSILGPVRVSDAGEPVKLDGPRIKALLAYLLLHANRAVPTSELLDALWGEEQPRSGATAVQNAIVRLRRSLGDRIVTVGSGYLVRVEAGELDLDRFRRLCREAAEAQPRERALLLGEALALWQGSALAGIEAAPFAPREAAALEDERIAALAARVDEELALGRHAELVPTLSTLAAEHPLDERFRAQLIVALYRSGRQAAALDVYRETRRLLMEELGLEPSPALRELERAVLTQDPSLDAPVDVPRSEPRAVEAAGRATLVAAAAEPGRGRDVRRGLLGLATAAAVATAGVALAVALTRNDQSAVGTATTILQISNVVSTVRAATTAEPPRAATAPQTRPRPTTGAGTAAGPATTPARGKPPPATTSPTARTVTVVGATTPRPATTARQPGPTTTVGHVTTPSVPPPKTATGSLVYTIVDDFSAATVNAARWQLTAHGAGVSGAQQDGRLEFDASTELRADGVDGADARFGTRCLLTGDFDATVGYRLLVWPENGGMWLGLGTYGELPNESFIGVRREGAAAGGGSESYTAEGGGFVRTSDAAGSLRLRRRGGRLTTYYRAGARWTALGTVTAPGAVHVSLTFAATGPQSGSRPSLVAFDDFRAEATTVRCPGVPLPPRAARSISF